jgi:hypothetical protein
MPCARMPKNRTAAFSQPPGQAALLTATSSNDATTTTTTTQNSSFLPITRMIAAPPGRTAASRPS